MKPPPLDLEWPEVVLWIFVMLIAALLAGCQTLPAAPPEVITRTNFVEVKVPTPVPCFTDADRPRLPEQPRLPDSATPDQRAAAVAAYQLEIAKYGEQVDALFMLCQSVGAKP
jgi:hypothetical protein